MQILEPFIPDDAFMFGSRPNVEPQPNQSISKESLSFDDVNYSLKFHILSDFDNIQNCKHMCFFITGHTCRFNG